MISGLFITFGNNPYFTTVKGFLINLWMFGTVIISKEYIRYRLINNVYENDKKEINIKCKVIGILKNKSYIYTGQFNHSTPSVSDLLLLT